MVAVFLAVEDFSLELEGGLDFGLTDCAGVGVGISEMGAGNRCAVINNSVTIRNGAGVRFMATFCRRSLLN